MVKEKLVLRKEIKKIIRKAMYTIIIFLLGMISVKTNPSLKKDINNTIYKTSPNYMKVKNVYKKYFGKLTNKRKTEPVITDKLSYISSKKYNNGVNLKVSNNYPVPSIEDGIIIYLENKKIVIYQVNGVEVEYSNINVTNYKLYDYVEKGKILGEVVSDELYLTFKKDGKYLDYKEYI